MVFKTMGGHCKCCGQCCSAFYVDMSQEELRERAAREKAFSLSMLESDAVFVIENCTPLSPEEACKRSPAIAEAPRWPRKNYWTCKYLRDKRLCQLDLDGLDKPHVCKGYPWYGKDPLEEKWLFPGCGYESSQITNQGKGRKMARIKVNDLSADVMISKEEMKKVFDGAKHLILG